MALAQSWQVFALVLDEKLRSGYHLGQNVSRVKRTMNQSHRLLHPKNPVECI